MTSRNLWECSWENDDYYDSKNCKHDDYKFHIIDEREGTVICTRCSCVIEENYMQSQVISDTPIQPEIEKSLTSKIKHLGIKHSYDEQKTILEDWTENNHISRGVPDRAIHNFNKLISRSYKDLFILRPTLEELTAFALHSTLLDELTPKSLGVISNITNVPVKRLNRIDCIVNQCMNTNMLKPSIWMPGLTPYLPLDFKDSQNVCRIADSIQEYYSFSPITILTCVLSWYMSETEKKTMSNQTLCTVTGIALSTLNRAMKIFYRDKTFNKFAESATDYAKL